MQKTQPSFWLGRVYKTWQCVQDKNIRITTIFIIKCNTIVCMYLEFAYPRDPHPCGDLFVYLCKSVSVYLCICVFVFLCFCVFLLLFICVFVNLPVLPKGSSSLWRCSSLGRLLTSPSGGLPT